VAVVLTLVQTKQIKINILVHKRNSTKNTVQTIKKCSKYKYTYYQNTHTLQNPHNTQHTHTHTHTHTHYKTS